MVTDEKKLVEKYKTEKYRLGHLQPRYLEVFEYRTGIADGDPHTQKETGKKFGKDLKSFSMNHVSEMLGIPKEAMPHQALNGAMQGFLVYKKLMKD